MAQRALVVEDDPSWRQILVELLADCGLEVDCAGNLPEAVTALRSAAHRLAVVDLSLGGSDQLNRDGLQVLAAARRHDPGCVCLLLTGFATVELAVSALTEYGAFTCLRKETFRRAEFRALVARALASPPPLAPEPTRSGSARADEARRTAPATRAPRVLVVEDDAGWRSILADLLLEAGCQARLCCCYGQALGCLRRARYRLAVIDLSLDCSMPPGQNLDGYRLLTAARAAGIPAIVVSGVATPDDVERTYAVHGVFACVEKRSFDRRLFRQTVLEALAAAQAENGPNALSRRERQVLALLAQGLTNQQIAERMMITTNTVKRHLKSIFAKLGVHTRTAAAARYTEL